MTPSTLSVPEASKLMQIHPKSTLALISDGVLPAGKLGRAYVLLYKDVMDHIEQVIVKQTAERMGATHRRRAVSRA